MSGCPSPEDLRRYLTCDSSLDAAQPRRIERHVEACERCQGELDRLTATAPPPGTTMPRPPDGFRVIRHLGSGTFGEVWLAEDLELDHLVALKVLKPRLVPEARGEALLALRHEARLLAQVRHPNVVQVFGMRRAGDDRYLVLQYVAGGSLAERLERDGPLGWQHAARFIADVGEGLLEVHARGIVHRDIKPANILWHPEKDEALLTDFGVAALLAGPAGAGRVGPLHGAGGVRR